MNFTFRKITAKSLCIILYIKKFHLENNIKLILNKNASEDTLEVNGQFKITGNFSIIQYLSSKNLSQTKLDLTMFILYNFKEKQNNLKYFTQKSVKNFNKIFGNNQFLNGSEISEFDYYAYVNLIRFEQDPISLFQDKQNLQGWFNKVQPVVEPLLKQIQKEFKLDSLVSKNILQKQQKLVNSPQQNFTTSKPSAGPSTEMTSVKDRVKESLLNTLQKALPNIQIKDVIIQSLNNFDYEYSSPSAMAIYNQNKKNLKDFKSVEELGKHIAAIFEGDEVIEKINFDNNFIQIRLTTRFIENEINVLLRSKLQYKQTEPQTIAVDFSSPNIAKEMHVGHLRSTIIGESTCRILEFLGHKVYRINHVGDWGTQFGMLICYMKEFYPDYLVNPTNLQDLNKFYKESKQQFDKDADFKLRSQQHVVKLQKGDSECRKAWTNICEISRKQFEEIYSRLNITLDECGESFYNEMLPSVIEECEKAGIVTLDKGAKCIFVENDKVPLIIVKGDGGFNYDSTDLACIKYRIQTLKCQRIIYITDLGQETHFKKIFKAAKMMQWSTGVRCEHMGFGLVLGEDGGKIKSRSGETVKLNDLLDEGKEMSLKQITARAEQFATAKQEQTPNHTTGTLLDVADYEKSAQILGISAVKYFDLKQNRTSDYKFSYKNMLATDGNTAVYLIYAYARICSIIRKSNMQAEELQDLADKQGWVITHPSERYVAAHLIKFFETLLHTSDTLFLHYLCDYLYTASTRIGEAYQKYRILDEEHLKTRILLCEALKRIMSKSFYLVGIEPLEKI